MPDGYRLILIGAPGCGKGTQSFMLKNHFKIPHLSTGDMLREAVSKKTELGLQAKAVMDRGDLVSDEVVLGLVERKILSSTCTNGFVLDGFPRTQRQAEMLTDLLNAHNIKVTAVIVFEIPLHELMERLCGRLIHPTSGRIYHVPLCPPKVPGKDDVTGEDLVRRNDDSEESVRKRYDLYISQTKPLVDYYKKSHIVHFIDASLPAATISANLVKLLSQPRFLEETILLGSLPRTPLSLTAIEYCGGYTSYTVIAPHDLLLCHRTADIRKFVTPPLHGSFTGPILFLLCWFAVC